MLARIALLVGLAYSGYLAGRQGIGAWYARQSSPDALESALRWNPADPQAFDDFGTIVHMYADGGSRDEVIGSYQAAARLSPGNAQYWSDLGAAYDWAGRENEALVAFGNAQELFPNSAENNWRVANFYVRQGKTAEALQSLRRVLAGDGVASRDVFVLVARTTRDTKTILDEALPQKSSVLLDYLNFCTQSGDINAAEETWHRLLELNLAFPLREALPYLDGLIRYRKLGELQEAWLSLSSRFPGEISPSQKDGNLIVNGGFEHEILNGGLDWRVVPVNGAAVSLDEENRLEAARSLRIDFDTTENPYYCHVYEYVRVKPGGRYHFSGYMRVKGITSDSGPAFEIYDAYDMKELFLTGEGLTGTSEWSREQFHFKAPANTDLLVVRVARRPSQKLANKIGGTVWVDKISLEAEN